MFTFFAVLAIIGFIGLIISFIMLVVEHEPFALWITLIYVCGAMLLVGLISGAILSEEDKDSTTPIIQEEQVEYNYCPYCGKEIKQWK